LFSRDGELWHPDSAQLDSPGNGPPVL